jgi:hypothetical protein
MYLRNPSQFAVWKATHSSLVDYYSALPELPTAFEHRGKTYKLDTSTWPAYRDASEEDVKKMWLEQVGSATRVAETLMKMRWAMLFSEEPVFITTDNPVAIVHPTLEFRGLNDAATSGL